MNIFDSSKRTAAKRADKAKKEHQTIAKPVVIELEDHNKYPKEKKYQDLLSYMGKYPRLEAHIFDYFYTQVKWLVDYDV